MGCQLDPSHGLVMGAIVYLLSRVRADAEEVDEAELSLNANELWKAGASKRFRNQMLLTCRGSIGSIKIR
jgi:hypothetical protein